MVVDIDHHLDARQMRRQRSAVRPAPGGVDGALGRGRLFVLGLARRDDLVGLFQSEQQLIFRQLLRTLGDTASNR